MSAHDNTAPGAPTAHSPRSLAAVIEHFAATSPGATALSAGGDDLLTYADLAGQLGILADRLAGLGIGRSDRVCTALPDGAAAAVAMLALASTAVCCPINPVSTVAECEAVFDRVHPCAVLLAQGASAQIRRACAQRSIPVIDARFPNRLVSGPVSLRMTGELLAASGEGESLILQTSGSTGSGKAVPLSTATILGGANATCRAYRLGPEDRRLNVMPMFHVQGFVGSVVASLCCGSSVLCASGFAPETLLDMVEREGVTWFSASPTMHRRILEHAVGHVRPLPLRFVRSGSGALDAGLRKELEAFYAVPVIESYGMTEAHQIASTPLVLGYRGEMVPTGSRVAVLHEATVHDRPGVTGELVVRGANVIDHYVGSDRGTDPSFHEDWFRTGDLGELLDDGTVRIVGRLKEMINRGGEKISPREVEEVLLQHEAVAEALVYGVPHAELIEEVAAGVVLTTPGAVADHELRDFVARRLLPHKAPRYFTRLDALPLSGTGKPSRLLLREKHAADQPAPVGSAPRPHAAPRTPLEARLTALWSKSLNAAPIGVHDDFYTDLGGESLAATALLAEIRAELGVGITHLEFADNAGTVARMAELLETRSAA